MHVGIIGAGLSGLATAALLAKQGHHVTIWEKNSAIGGRAFVWKQQGFTFDMGPSWYLMPEVFEKYFALFGKSVADFYTLRQLDPGYKVFWSDKTQTTVPWGTAKIATLFESLELGAGVRFSRYMATSKQLYQVALDHFLYQDYSNVFKLAHPRVLAALGDPRLYASWERWINRQFRSPKIRKILAYPTVFLGGSPADTPALYSMMSYVDFQRGVWYPEGGIGQVVKALQQLCEQYKVTIHLNSEVAGVNVRKGTVRSVQVAGKKHPVDVLVSSGDLAWFQNRLLPAAYQEYPESYWQSKTMAPAMVLVYLGLSKPLPRLAHHNFYFSDSWDDHFASIRNQSGWPQDPSVYISCPSKTDATLAPKGKEVVFGLIPVAAGLEEDQSQSVADAFVAKLSHLAGTNIQKTIEVQRVVTVSEFTQLFYAYQGSSLGLAHTLWQSAFFRPRLKSHSVNNLYFTGANTNPGIGMPMVLISAQLVSQKIRHEYRH